MSLVAPVIHGLLEMGELSSLSSPTTSIGKFHQCLSSELRKKFSAVSSSSVSLQAFCSALDPRFRDLSFLSDLAAQTLRANITEQLFANESELVNKVSVCCICGTFL